MVFERPHPTHSPRRHRPAGFILAALAAGSWLLARRCHRLEVVGESMLPAFAPGDRLLAVEGLPVRPGDVVAVEDPRGAGRILVKRVLRVSAGTVEVRGDNDAATTDSRVFGPVRRSKIRGRVVYRYSPPDRAGRLR